MQKIIQYLESNEVTVASGRITPERFQQLGILFGMHGKVQRPLYKIMSSNIQQAVSTASIVRPNPRNLEHLTDLR